MAKYIYKLLVSNQDKFRLELYSDQEYKPWLKIYDFDYEDENTSSRSYVKFYGLSYHAGSYFRNLNKTSSNKVERFFKFIEDVAKFYIYGNIDFNKAIFTYSESKKEWSARYGKTLVEYKAGQFNYQDNLASKKEDKETIDINAIEDLSTNIHNRIASCIDMALLASLPGQAYLSNTSESKIAMYSKKMDDFIMMSGAHDSHGTNQSYRQSRDKGSIVIIQPAPGNIPGIPFVMPEKFQKIGYEYILKASRTNLNDITQLKKFIIPRYAASNESIASNVGALSPRQQLSNNIYKYSNYLYRFYFIIALNKTEEVDSELLKNNAYVINSWATNRAHITPILDAAIFDAIKKILKSYKYKVLIG